MWQIWKAKSSKSFNGEISDPNDIVNKDLFDFHEYESKLIPSFSPIVIPVCNDDRNIIMAQDGVVVFADASVHKEKKTTNIGVVVMIAMVTYFMPLVPQFNMLGKSSAIAIRMAMENAREKGWTKVQILSYAKNVVDMVLQRTIVS
ncbi:hypothetical protein RDI58_020017 [Solanum bulbocastanum]|uniref:Uncharacterized protein n=1 Tax=Solanum bulbocastanum TaxID=147425 RepID=A0AAN8TBB4_SOLBU